MGGNCPLAPVLLAHLMLGGVVDGENECAAIRVVVVQNKKRGKYYVS